MLNNSETQSDNEQSLLSVLEVKASLGVPISSLILGFIVFLVLFIPFTIVASLFGVTVLDVTDLTEAHIASHKFQFFSWRPTWTAFTMCLLVGAVIGTHRFGMKRYIHTAKRFTKNFVNNDRIFESLISMSDHQINRLRKSTYIGFLIGILASWVLIIRTSSGWEDLLLTPRPWFIIVAILLITLLARMITLSSIEHQNLRLTFSTVRLKNLFVHKPLTIFIRIALRRLFCWMILIAISVLFFIGGEDIAIVGIPWVIIATLTAIKLFISTIGIGTALIERHKSEELDELRIRIELYEKRITEDDSNAATLLLAHLEMERRIENLAALKFETPVALRALSYVLFPIIAWFGASFVRILVNSFLSQ